MSIRLLETLQKPMEVQMLKARMLEIERKLIDGTPGIVDAMIDVHKMTQQHEELVLLMSDEDIQLLHKAFEKHKGFVLVAKQAKEIKKNKKLTDKDLANL